MNPVLMLMYNRTEEQLRLSQQALASVLSQDVGNLAVTVVDNGSSPETWQWLQGHPLNGDGWTLEIARLDPNTSPLRIANFHMGRIFRRFPHVLGVPNDVILPTNAYRLMLEWRRGFVCASDAGQNHLPSPEPCHAVSENTPMAVMVTRKWAYDALVGRDGYFFDEGMFHYASDCDLALRMAACGIRGVQLSIPYWHFGSGSWRMLPPAEGRKMTLQADADRAYFARKWGFRVDSLEYGKNAQDPNWR